MAAPKGNNYWQFRNKHGRDFIYTPEFLWDEFIDYSNWLEECPLYEIKVFCFKGEVTKVNVPKMRAMTLSGFCLFADIALNTFKNYRDIEDFLTVTHAIDEAIKSQKFEGAAAELLNPNIIARDLGLTDKKELSGVGGKDLEPPVFVFKNLNKENE
jgi:hypothetical protein